MTRTAAWAAGPVVFVTGAAVLLGVWLGPVHWAAAAVALGLCLPPAAGTYWLTRRLAARHPLGGVLGMLIGTLVRLVVVMGGGAAVFLGTGWFAEAKVAFWLWLLITYLAVLVAEMVVLTRSAVPAGGVLVAKG